MNVTVLTPEQIARIHETSLAILAEVGVEVPHAEMLGRFADAGAGVDFKLQRVRIPPELVARSVAQAGKRFAIYGRDISKQAAFGEGRRNYNSIGGEALWLDEPGQKRRYATLDDVATAARFGDALDSINIVGAMSDPHELPVAARCVEVMATMLKNTTKPIHFWYHDRASARYLNEMMVAVRGSEAAASQHPLCYPFLEPISPLRFPFHGIDILFETSRLNLPVPIGPMAQMGISSPATVAGTLAQENAEILAGICVVQLVRAGTPVCYGGICHAFDMRTTQLIFSGPEQAIFGVAMTQMGKHYGLPVYINVGLTDAKRPDAQAGLEAGTTLVLGAAAGADIFGHMGISGVDQASSLDMLVMQDEVIRFVESVLREVDFSDDALALDEVLSADRDRSFAGREHTVRHFRRELWFPRLLDRSYYDEWLDSGATDMEERCRRRKAHILETHRPEPPPDGMARSLDRIVSAARRELVGTQRRTG
jgi:trimethylamine--corrinoid protein Co-methyltransferase